MNSLSFGSDDHFILDHFIKEFSDCEETQSDQVKDAANKTVNEIFLRNFSSRINFMREIKSSNLPENLKLRAKKLSFKYFKIIDFKNIIELQNSGYSKQASILAQIYEKFLSGIMTKDEFINNLEKSNCVEGVINSAKTFLDPPATVELFLEEKKSEKVLMLTTATKRKQLLLSIKKLVSDSVYLNFEKVILLLAADSKKLTVQAVIALGHYFYLCKEMASSSDFMISEFVYTIQPVVMEKAADVFQETSVTQRSRVKQFFVKICANHNDFDLLNLIFPQNVIYQELSMLVMACIERGFSKKEDIDFLKNIIDNRVFFALLEPYSHLSYVEIFRNSPQIAPPLDISLPIENSLESLKLLVQWAHLPTDEAFAKYLSKKEEIQLEIDKLSSADSKLGEMFSAIFKKNLDKESLIERDIFRIMEQQSDDTAKQSTGKKIKCNIVDLEAYCAHHNLWKVLTNFFEKKFQSLPECQFDERIVFHLFQDKLMLIESPLSGFYAKSCAGVLLRTFESMENDLNVDQKTLTENNDYLLNSIVPLLKDVVLFDSRDSKNAQLRVWKRISSMKTGDRFLLPIGCSTHSTGLLIEKKENKNFRFTLYNTGSGVQKHPRVESGKFQTFMVVDEIPPESVLKKQRWNMLLEIYKSGKINESYAMILNNLAEGGKVLPGSPVEEEYESPQLSGTCSMQNLLAMIRHQVMLNAPGGPAEKKAVYKQIKIQLRSVWLKDHAGQDLSQINDLDRIFAKVGAEKRLVDLAADPEACEKAISECQGLLLAAGIKDVELLYESLEGKNSFARHTLLSNIAVTISFFCMTQELEIPKELETNPIVGLAQQKHLSKQLMFINFENSLTNYESQEKVNQWIEGFEVLLTRTNFYEVAVNKLIQKLKLFEVGDGNGSSPPFASMKNPPKAGDLIKMLTEQLKVKFPAATATMVIARLYGSLATAGLGNLIQEKV